MTNKIIKTLILDKSIRLYFTDNTKMLQEIMELSKIKDKTCYLALAKAVSIMSLLSVTLKDNQRISAVITLTDKNYKMYVDTDAEGNVRGYVNQALLIAPQQKNSNSTLQDFIGTKASIRIMKGFETNHFTGITDMPYQNLDDDFAYYFKQSEQTDTMIQTKVKLDSVSYLFKSYGIYAQALPGAEEGALDLVREQFEAENLAPLLLSMNDAGIEKELNQRFPNSKVLEHKPIQFACHCSKEMFYGFLYSLPVEELQNAVESNTSIDTTCHICGQNYVFIPSEIQTILQTR
ncbi:Hsp33 family molecular chaperone HslO [Oceanobacillus jeddahense]|uniref:Hsp33 family molecular chaperone HslO n=1 Tax=Oceanobacillus jeddahense TaxID=1462527 RepID=UPI000595F2DF|nr:Hsp33 family molecular chaperone HslO [Oceanobacillus jeddahense]